VHRGLVSRLGRVPVVLILLMARDGLCESITAFCFYLPLLSVILPVISSVFGNIKISFVYKIPLYLDTSHGILAG
jgi:hypothetical protein